MPAQPHARPQSLFGSRPLRVVLLGVVLALVGAACNSSDTAGDIRQDVEEGVRDVDEKIDFTFSGDFELAGRVKSASLGDTPDVDIPAIEEDAGEDASRQPKDPGTLEVTVETVSESLTSGCGMNAGDVVRVFWTNDTLFDPSGVLTDRFPDNLVEGSVTAKGKFGTVDIDVKDKSPDDGNACVLVLSSLTLGR